MQTCRFHGVWFHGALSHCDTTHQQAEREKIVIGFLMLVSPMKAGSRKQLDIPDRPDRLMFSKIDVHRPGLSGFLRPGRGPLDFGLHTRKAELGNEFGP